MKTTIKALVRTLPTTFTLTQEQKDQIDTYLSIGLTKQAKMFHASCLGLHPCTVEMAVKMLGGTGEVAGNDGEGGRFYYGGFAALHITKLVKQIPYGIALYLKELKELKIFHEFIVVAPRQCFNLNVHIDPIVLGRIEIDGPDFFVAAWE